MREFAESKISQLGHNGFSSDRNLFETRPLAPSSMIEIARSSQQEKVLELGRNLSKVFEGENFESSGKYRSISLDERCSRYRDLSIPS